MLVLTVTMLAAWLAMVAAPDTAIARALHRWLVAAPARRLAAIERGQVLLALLLALAVAGAIWIFEDESARLIALAVPDVIAWATMFEVSTLLDAVVATATLATAVRWRGLRGAITRRLRGSAKPRQRRTNTGGRRHPPANDDERHAPSLAA